MLVPVRCGNSNRADLLTIRDSILQGLGNQFTNTTLSNVDIICDALARACYNIWQVYGNVSNQFDPNTMDTMLSRWEAIFNLQPILNEPLDLRRAAIATKFALINQIPTQSNIITLMNKIIPQIFELLITIPESAAVGGGIPTGIIGGLNTLVAGAGWFSTAASLYIDIHRPSSMSQYTFWNQAYLIFPVLNSYLPAWTSFDWFSATFNNSDGYGNIATLTAVEGINNGTTTHTTLTNSACGITAGTIIELSDNVGVWHQLTVATIVNNTSLTFTSVPANFTNQPFWIDGFFADCNSSTFPYPINAYNCDSAPI